MTPLLPPTFPLPARSGRPGDPPEAIRAWLAGLHAGTAQARLHWSTHGVAMLPLGAAFGAVRIPGALVQAAAGSDADDVPTDVARTALDGPVIYDMCSTGPTYWALVPYRNGMTWEEGVDTPLLGPGSYLAVPDITVVRPPGPHWVMPPRYRRDLCPTDHVAEFIRHGHRQLHALQESAGGPGGTT